MPRHQRLLSDALALSSDSVNVGRRRLLAAAIVAIAAVAACRDDTNLPTQDGRPAPSRAVRPSVGPKPRQIRGAEQSFADLAAGAPSAGGWYFDEAGTLVVQVRDSSDFSGAASVARQLVTSRMIQSDSRFQGKVTVRPAEFTFYQLASWRDSIFEHVLGRPGVSSLDLDEKRNRVVIGLDPNTRAILQQQLPLILTRLGIDTDAVVFEAAPPLRLLSSTNGSITGHVDTLVGGIAMSVDLPGGSAEGSTIGVVLDYGGTRSILTCSHCTRNDFSPDGDTAKQATSNDRRFGYETSDPSTNTCGTWPFTFSCRNSDAAIYTLFSTDTSAKGLIARTTYYGHSSSGSLTWDTTDPYFVITSTTPNPGSGVIVNKMGQATGWTYGQIVATCVDAIMPSGVKVLCSTKADYYGDEGDSGGPVFIWDGASAVWA